VRKTDVTDTGWCVWITGLPGSGKSMVSDALLTLLCERGARASPRACAEKILDKIVQSEDARRSSGLKKLRQD
jgi:DNA repair ATPase RecN